MSDTTPDDDAPLVFNTPTIALQHFRVGLDKSGWSLDHSELLEKSRFTYADCHVHPIKKETCVIRVLSSKCGMYADDWEVTTLSLHPWDAATIAATQRLAVGHWPSVG